LNRHRAGFGGAFVMLGCLLAPACSSGGGGAEGEGPGAVPASCTNGVRDGDERGIDCGGACRKCTGEECVDGSDCTSGACAEGVCGASVGKLCGVGTPASCERGQPCELDADCTSNLCPDGTCGVPIGPDDGIQNNGETDVDCGGPNAPGCAAGKKCDGDDDCAELYCPEASPRICVTPRNDDGVKNGTETDIDCGGQSGIQCAVGKSCLVDGDCTAACNYAKKCVEAPSCKPRMGGDTCGSGEVGQPGAQHESCCRSLEVPGYTDPRNPGRTVLLDKYEVTAGRVRAFIEALAAANNGQPNVKAWITANRPPLWDTNWDLFLASGTNAAAINVPRRPTTGTAEPNPPWPRNVGTHYAFGAPLYIYVHGHNCGQPAGSYGYPTFFYPKAVMENENGGLERATPVDGNGVALVPKDYLDVKSMTCIPSLLLAAFCHWDGGQLATDAVLDFVTGSTNGAAAGCNGPRCPPRTDVIAASDAAQYSGQAGTAGANNYLYYWPYFAGSVTHEGVSRIAAPGRATTDVVRFTAGAEPWMDVRGNLQELALAVTGATFTGNFTIRYDGIGYSSARAGGNNGPPPKYQYPEYKAGYTGGRCMRFR
jgi:hypothetical protein